MYKEEKPLQSRRAASDAKGKNWIDEIDSSEHSVRDVRGGRKIQVREGAKVTRSLTLSFEPRSKRKGTGRRSTAVIVDNPYWRCTRDARRATCTKLSVDRRKGFSMAATCRSVSPHAPALSRAARHALARASIHGRASGGAVIVHGAQSERMRVVCCKDPAQSTSCPDGRPGLGDVLSTRLA